MEIGYIFFSNQQILIGSICLVRLRVLVFGPLFEQTDGTYMHSIEKLLHKVCVLLREKGDEHQRRCLRASSLQCLSAMVVFLSSSLVLVFQVQKGIFFIEKTCASRH